MTLSTDAKLLCIFALTLMVPSLATEEKAIPISDEGEGNQCDQNDKVASVCLACSSLPFKVAVNLVDCCTENTAFQFCDACVNDQESCEKVMDEIEAVRDYSELDEDFYDNNEDVYDNPEYGIDTFELENANDGREKRYGTLFMKSPKRYGSLFFGKRAPEKRYGRLYMGSGSHFGKRSQERPVEFGETEQGFDEDDDRLAKRFGYILGSSYKLGKRGDRSGVNEYVPPKRFGPLFVGRNKMFGKRDVAKRFGRLFVGSKGVFGKRSDQDDDELYDMDKRYGRLFTGRRRGMLFG